MSLEPQSRPPTGIVDHQNRAIIASMCLSHFLTTVTKKLTGQTICPCRHAYADRIEFIHNKRWFRMIQAGGG